MQKNAQALMEKILEIFENVGDGEGSFPPQKELEKLLTSAYEAFVGKYRPLLKVAPAVVGKLGPDLVPVLASLLRLFNTIQADEGLIAEQTVMQKRRATDRQAALKIYLAAGFTRPEAMAFILQDAAGSTGRSLGEAIGKSLSSRERMHDRQALRVSQNS